MCEASLPQDRCDGVGELLVPHQDVTDLRIQSDERMPLLKYTPVFFGFEEQLDVPRHYQAVRRVPVDVVPPGLVGFRFDGNPYSRNVIDGFGETFFESSPHAVEIECEWVLVPVDAGPDDRELGLQLPVKLQRLGEPFDGNLSDLFIWVGE